MKSKIVNLLFIGTYLTAMVAVIFFATRSVIQKESSPKEKAEQITIPEIAESPSPSKVIAISCWSLTLPIEDIKDSNLPLTVRQPELGNFSFSPWFETNKESDGVIFRAPVNAPTTKNSDYPRSELRETECGENKNKFWSSTNGTHSLYLDQAITATPKNKPDVVAGQIHGDDDDIVTIRLEDKKLYVARNKSDLCVLDDNYSLGKRFGVKFVIKDGLISIYYNDNPQFSCSLEKKVSKAYFKAGAYTQSNCKTEGKPELCTSKNYGEVVIYEISITHSH